MRGPTAIHLPQYCTWMSTRRKDSVAIELHWKMTPSTLKFSSPGWVGCVCMRERVMTVFWGGMGGGVCACGVVLVLDLGWPSRLAGGSASSTSAASELSSSWFARNK